MTRVKGLFVAIVLALLSSLLAGSAQGNQSIAGTVYAVSGGNLQGANVIACLLENDECSDSRSVAQAISGGSSAKYQLSNLEAGESYLMLAWKDVNANGEVDAGDELGVYTKAGKPALVEPPAAGIDLRMAKFSGDLDALLAQAEDSSAASPAPPAAPPAPAPNSSGLTLSGRVQQRASGSLQGALVIAGVFVKDQLDLKTAQAVKVDSSGAFSVANLEKKRYGLFAWRDLDGDKLIGAKDEFGVYTSSGRVALATPPLNGVTLQLKNAGLTDYDAMRDLFLPAPTASSNTTPSNTALAGSAISYAIPKNWRSTGGGNYVTEFGGETASSLQGTLDIGIFPPRAKSGPLAAQTRAIWQAETKGGMDIEGQRGAVFVRRTASGLNVGVTFGTVTSFDNPDPNSGRFSRLNTYSVLFVVETGAQVTPIFFKMSRAETAFGYFTYEKDGRPQMLSFLSSVKSAKPVTLPPLYAEKDLIGKWTVSTNSYSNTNWYNSSGSYVTSTYVLSGLTSKLTFNSGGVGQYFSQLTIINSGVATTKTENEPMKWRISGDQIIMDRLKSGYKTIYQLFGRGVDARGDPVLLADYRIDQTVADLDASPKDTWVVAK